MATPTEILSAAVILLDDLGSRTLSQPDFYRNMEEAGLIAGDLMKPVVNNGAYYDGIENTSLVVEASKCLLSICTEADTLKWLAALDRAQSHAANLYRISESMS